MRSPFTASRESAVLLRMVIRYSERDVEIRSGGFTGSSVATSDYSLCQTSRITWLFGASDSKIIDQHEGFTGIISFWFQLHRAVFLMSNRRTLLPKMDNIVGPGSQSREEERAAAF